MEDWDPRNSHLMDGPKLFAWLETRRRIRGTPQNPPDARLSASDRRRLNQWKNGGSAQVIEAVDPMLNKLNLTLQEVPIDIYIDKRHGGGHPVSESAKARAVKMYRGGLVAAEVAKVFGVHETTVRKWANDKGR